MILLPYLKKFERSQKMKHVSIALMVLSFFLSVNVYGFQQPDDGFSFGEIKKINQEVQSLYEEYLRKEILKYTQGKLKFTSTFCQTRAPQIGCITYSQNRQYWSLRVDLITARELKLVGFKKLILKRFKNRKQTLNIFDSRGRVIRFFFKNGKIQPPVIPLGHSTISYQKVENIIFHIDNIYNEFLKKPMAQYSGEQWNYPLPKCDKNLLFLGCASYVKSPEEWTMAIHFNKQTTAEFSGFHKMKYRKHPDGLSELEVEAPRNKKVYFPIVNGILKDIFIPADVKRPIEG